MTDTLRVGEGLREALAGAGIASAADLVALGLPPGETSVRRPVALALARTSGRFYFKGYRYADWRASRGLIGRGTLFGEAPELREMRALQWLRDHDLPAVRPIAAAARTRAGRLVEHALLTELVDDAPDLGRRLRDPTDVVCTTPAIRLALAAELGGTLAAMHRHGFVHRDCHARNVLVRVQAGTPRIWLLDCRRGGLRRGPGAHRAKRYDLACLRVDLRPREEAVFTAADWRALLIGYLGTKRGTEALDRRVEGMARAEARRQAARARRRARRG